MTKVTKIAALIIFISVLLNSILIFKVLAQKEAMGRMYTILVLQEVRGAKSDEIMDAQEKIINKQKAMIDIVLKGNRFQ